jgi:hypothetical protein
MAYPRNELGEVGVVGRGRVALYDVDRGPHLTTVFQKEPLQHRGHIRP